MKLSEIVSKLKQPFYVGLLVLLAGLIVHFWYVFLNFNNALYGGPGDHTAGLIWLYEQDPTSPWWNFTNMSAFPFGDSLWNPTFILGQAYYVLFWIFASVLGSGIAGFNMMVIFGMSISFVSIYWFLSRYTAVSSLIAATFAYCSVFNPFLLALIGVGHLTYIFSGAYVVLLLYLLIQTFIHERRSNLNAIFLGLFIGSTWLVDPYFVLFVALLVAGWLLGFVVLMSKTNGIKDIINAHKKRLGLIAGMTFLALTPLLIFTQINSDSLQKNTLDVRSDIRTDVGLYSMRIKDLILPSESNPFIPEKLRDYKLATYHGKNPTFTTYIGWTTILLTVLIITLSVMSPEYRKHIKQITTHEKLLILTSITATLMLLAFSFPTKVNLAGFDIYTPTELLISFSGIWRVLARSYIFFLPLIFIIIAIFISSLSKVKSLRIWYMVAICLVVLMPFDFLHRNVFDSEKYFDLQRDIPATYENIKTSDHIQSIAEYPLREAPHYRGSLYFTGQLFHEKKLFNSIVTVTDQTYIRESLMDLNNPQTLRTLSFLGVDAIHVWSNTTQQWNGDDKDGINKIGSSSFPNMFGNDKTALYELNLPDQKTLEGRYMLVPQWDARMTNGEYISDVFQTIPKKATMKVVDLCDVINLSKCKDPASEKTVFKGFITFLNDSKNDHEVSINIDGESTRYIIPAEGKLSISIKPDITIDTLIKTDILDTEGTYIYGYHVK